MLINNSVRGKAMKLIAINGSLRREGGLTQKIIDSVFEGAISKGADCKTIRLAKCQINRCTACEYCQTKEEYTCVFEDKDDFENVISQIKDADIVLFATPIYVFQMSSLMKIFLERYHGHGKSKRIEISRKGLMFHDFEKELREKAFVSIIVSDNIEFETTYGVREYFRTFGKFMGAEQVGEIIRNGGRIMEKRKREQGKVYEALKRAGIELVEKKRIRRNTEKKIARNIVRVPKILLKLLKKIEIGKKIILKKSEEFA